MLPVVPIPPLQVVSVDTNFVNFSISTIPHLFSFPFAERTLLYRQVSDHDIVDGVGDFEYGANCTLGSCSSPYLKANTRYAFVIQEAYFVHGISGSGECFSGVTYMTTRPHGKKIFLKCFVEIGG